MRLVLPVAVGVVTGHIAEAAALSSGAGAGTAYQDRVSIGEVVCVCATFGLRGRYPIILKPRV